MPDPIIFVKSLIDLGSFDHDSCDALLAQKGTSVANAFYANEPVATRNVVYVGLNFFLVGEMIALAMFLIFRRDAELRRYALGFAVFAVMFLICLGIQLEAMSQYDEACRALWPH
jgi:hypothetical protein